MLYDAYEHDEAADLLLGAGSPDRISRLPLDLLEVVGDARLSRALQSGDTPNVYDFVFDNSHGARVTMRGPDYSVRLTTAWLPPADKEEVFGLSADDITDFLRGVDALPVATRAGLGKSGLGEF